MTPPGLLSIEPFTPHPYAHIIEAGVFPSDAMPEAAYAKLLKDYAALTDITVSRITYESDGLKITGLMAAPARPASCPLLIYNRGGSREYGKLTVLSVLRSMAPYARKNYLALASNYRGNDGGEGREEFGGKDVDDVLRLLAIGRAHPAFDGKNTFMIGHSRGAMMTYLSLKGGAKLNAAVGIAGIADAHGLAAEPSMVKNVLRPLVPDYDRDPQAALSARSALDWPQALAAPLMLLHGTADTIVPPSHSIRLAGALQQRGMAHTLHLYEGGNHALVRAWDDVLLRTTEWMEQYRQ